jgi:glycosyltransferase involved in cell wall biosynthesis
MHIGFLYGQRIFPPGIGGSVHGYQLAKGLVDRGHRLYSWYYGDDHCPLVTHLRGRQVVSFLRTVEVLYVRADFRMSSTFAWLRLLHGSYMPVIWELNGMPEELLYEGGRDEDLRLATGHLRRLARLVDAGIGVTQEIADYLRQELGIARTYCIPNGSDPELFRPAPTCHGDKAPLKVVWIGSSERGWHALSALVGAAAAIHRAGANVRFLIFGDPANLPSDLPPNITPEGVVPYAEMGARLATADVGVHVFSPLPDGRIMGASPLKLFDYMACGLAVIAQENGQRGEVIRQWNAGLFTSGKPADLADRILQLEKDRGLCRQLGQNGRRAVLEYYNWRRVAVETETVLQAVIRSRMDGSRLA